MNFFYNLAARFNTLEALEIITSLIITIIRVATYHPLQNSLIFPDILQFSIPSDKSKKFFFILYFNGVNCITSNLGVTLKGKNLLPWGANCFL